ncbi:MAG: efflux RND transporter periplasmic adaptor subunit [Dehalococcoidia bacterium]|jgi:multidrug efflux pump subunit AcrA (membrane-fusion protein)
MKKFRAISSILLVLLIGVIALSCTSKSNTAAAAGQTATVQSGNLSVDILASGNLVTANEADLAFYSAGTVEDVLVKIGDNVTEGQELAKLDTAPLESNLAQAKIDVETAQMNLENAEEPQTDSSGTVISAPDPLNIDIKQLQLQNAQANQTEAQKELDKATITAPFAGLVTNVNVVPGDQVAANFVGVRIIDPVNFQVNVLVSEMQIYNLSIGTPATVQAVALSSYTFPGKVSLIAEAPTIQSNVVNYQVTVLMDPVDAATLQAQLNRTSAGSASARSRPSGAAGQTSNSQAAANTQSGSQTSSDNRTSSRQASSGQPSGNQTAAGPNSTSRSYAGQSASAGGQNQQAQATTTVPADFRLREGLTVTVSIVTAQKTNILLVPNKAITSQGGRYYVQVVSGGTTTQKVIQTGITDGQNTEVVSGLNAGDVVSTATNIVASTTTNSQQQRAPTSSITSIPGVRLPTSR